MAAVGHMTHQSKHAHGVIVVTAWVTGFRILISSCNSSAKSLGPEPSSLANAMDPQAKKALTMRVE